MYEFSRAIYRELSPHILSPRPGAARDNHHEVLRACESAVRRLATDRQHFARPARTLFTDIRLYFPLSAQERVLQVVTTYMGCAQRLLVEHPDAGLAFSDEPMRCRATTHGGTPCRRIPLAHNGYCPSHQHLAETEDAEQVVAA